VPNLGKTTRSPQSDLTPWILTQWQSNNNDSYKKLQKNDLQILVNLSQLLAEIIICFCSAKTGEQRMAFDLKRCQKHTK